MIYRGVLLYGESGSGKSSLINAGLIPAAEKEGFRADRIRVQPRLNEELVVERIVAAADGASFLPSSFADETEGAPARIVLSTEAALSRLHEVASDTHPLLVFDQFEELVTLFEDSRNGTALSEVREAQVRIIAMLVQLLRDRTVPVKVVFGFREDYLAQVKDLLSRCPELLDQSLRLTAPTTDALGEIIRAPFEKHPGHFDSELSPELSERLSAKIAARSETGTINLSEVEIVCLRLWQSRDPEQLLAEKDIQGVLEEYLQESLTQFTDADRDLAVGLLSEMVTPQGTRNVISVDDLVDHVRGQENVDGDRLQRILRELTETRLIRSERRHDLDLYEIVSEFLLPWINEQREERLRARAVQAEAERQAKVRRKLALLAIGSLVLAAVLAAIGIYAYHAERDASRGKAAAEANAKAADAFVALQNGTPVRGLGLAQEAVSGAEESPQAEGALRQAIAQLRLQAPLAEPAQGASTADISSDGRRAVTANLDGTARVQDIATGQTIAVLGQVGGSPVRRAVFSPSGALVATATDTGTYVWSVATHSVRTPPTQARADDVAFRDGTHVVIVNADGTLRRWNLATGESDVVALGTPARSPPTSAALSRDGRLLATTDDAGRVRVWNTTTGAPVGVPLEAAGSVTNDAFSRDGRLLVTLSAEGAAQVWNVENGKRLNVLLPVEGAFPNSAALNADGTRVMTATSDGTARVWDGASGSAVAVLGQPGDPSVESAVFSPDDSLVVTVPIHGAPRVWDLLSKGRTLGRPSSTTDLETGSPAPRIAFDPSGTFVAASTDGTVDVWNIVRGNRAATLHGSAAAVAFRDGTHVVVAGTDGTVRIWDVKTGKSATTPLHVGRITNGAFGRNAALLAAADANGTLRVWKVSTGKLVDTSSVTGESLTSGAFNPDGSLLVTANSDGTAHIWRIGTDTRLTLGGDEPDPTRSISSAAFSPDGKLVLTTGLVGGSEVWDVEHPGSSIAHDGPPAPLGAVFGPDSRVIVFETQDGSFSVWEARNLEKVASLEGRSRAVAAGVAVATGSAGTRMVTALGDGTLQVRVCTVCGSVRTLRELAGTFNAKGGTEHGSD